MIIKVSHTTEYTYSTPVFLECQKIKLKPKSDHTQKLVSYDLHISPVPFNISSGYDVENNYTYYACFEDLTDKLIVTVDFVVNTYKKNPFDFIVESDFINLPISYPAYKQIVLTPYLLRDSEAFHGSGIRKLADDLLNKDNNTLNFLNNLNNWIYEHFEYTIRLDGNPNKPEESLQELKGSCRDMAVLFIDVCRLVGVAARFVSGYLYNEETRDNAYMHAWAEIYLPGAGWIGYDPSQGLVATDSHIPVASSAYYENATPICGTFRGTGAQALIESSVVISKL